MKGSALDHSPRCADRKKSCFLHNKTVFPPFFLRLADPPPPFAAMLYALGEKERERELLIFRPPLFSFCRPTRAFPRDCFLQQVSASPPSLLSLHSKPPSPLPAPPPPLSTQRRRSPFGPGDYPSFWRFREVGQSSCGRLSKISTFLPP